MFYAPVILYVYAYVLYDGVLGETDSSLTKWFDIYLTGVPPYPPTTRMYVAHIWQGSDRQAKVVFDTAEKFWDIKGF